MITELMAALPLMDQALGTVKSIMSSESKFKESELKYKLADVMSQLVDIKPNMQAELQKKDTIIRELREKLNIKESMEFRSPVYYKRTDVEFKEPFCQKCFEDAGKQIRLTENSHNYCDGSIYHKWKCNACLTAYNF